MRARSTWLACLLAVSLFGTTLGGCDDDFQGSPGLDLSAAASDLLARIDLAGADARRRAVSRS